MRNRTVGLLLALAIPPLVFSAPARAGNCPAPIVFTDSGINGAAIQATVDNFRAAIGGVNHGVGGSFPDGRRESNWDGTSDGESTPGYYYPAFLNDVSPRGLVFVSGDRPWARVAVSADAINAANTAVRFGNLNASYATAFGTFTPERLLGLLDSNVVDLIFYVPDTPDRALVSAVGAVFVDVDVAATSRLQLFDIGGALLADAAAPASPGDADLSFVGVFVPSPCRVARARLTLGAAPLGLSDITQGGLNDIVVIDDLIWGEPQGVVFLDDFDLLQDTSLWD